MRVNALLSAAQWIEQLDLQPHPEGGFYRETYRSPHMVATQGLPDRFSGDRSLATAIYYLLRAEDVSRLHRLRADEIWYFHAGNPLILHQIHPEGAYRRVRLGLNPVAGRVPQHVVPAGCWFGAEIAGAEVTDAEFANDENGGSKPAETDTGGFCLVSCSLAPGFDFADFDLADREFMLSNWPQHAALIEKLV
jgi:predicted cupin superfamily sugar epimerase